MEPVLSRRTLRVLCYNIHYGQGNDGEYNLQRLADVINAAKPDLVALQEVDVGVKRSGRLHEVRILGELTNLKSHFGPMQHYEGGLFGNAVLTNLPVENVLIQPLPYTEATPELTTYPRGAISVIVKLPNGEQLNFISTHFQHNLEADRVAEAKAINQFFAVDNGWAPLLQAFADSTTGQALCHAVDARVAAGATVTGAVPSK